MKKILFLSLILTTCYLRIYETFAISSYVLIIGDSISMGFMPYVEKAISQDILVKHNPGNAASTINGIENLEYWLEPNHWDLILFNSGLHDLVYKNEHGEYDTVKGKVSVPIDSYKKNLEIILAKLIKTKARIIFINTTMVPANSYGRKMEDPAKYNEAANEVMKENGIEVLDLYTLSLAIYPLYHNKAREVHYSEKGYELLAGPVIETIYSSLPKNNYLWQTKIR